MNRLIVVTALVVLAGSSANAGDIYTFDVNGRKVQVIASTNCRSTSCVSVSVPGISESGKRHKGKSAQARAGTKDRAVVSGDAPNTTIREKTATATPAATHARQPAAATHTALATAGPQAKPGRSHDEAKSAVPPPEATRAPLTVPDRAAATPSLEPANGKPVGAGGTATATTGAATAPTTVAAAVATQPSPAPAAPQAAVPVVKTPVGVWLTEEKEGKVRIEPCGTNLCGYAVDDKTNANGERILINMKPATAGDKWSGRIHDPNTGGNYDSTIALNNPDKLKVRGCAFGGMFCGGQTWSRLE